MLKKWYELEGAELLNKSRWKASTESVTLGIDSFNNIYTLYSITTPSLVENHSYLVCIMVCRFSTA